MALKINLTINMSTISDRVQTLDSSTHLKPADVDSLQPHNSVDDSLHLLEDLLVGEALLERGDSLDRDLLVVDALITGQPNPRPQLVAVQLHPGFLCLCRGGIPDVAVATVCSTELHHHPDLVETAG